MTEAERPNPPLDSQQQAASKAEAVDRAHRYLLQMRDMDNELMWTRSNIILLVQGGLLVTVAA